MWIQPLLRDDLRAYYGVPDDKHGFVVTRVMPGRTGDGVIEPGDVILKVDGYEIDDEGTFTHETHGRLNASHLFQGRRYAGITVPASILRKGEVKEVELELRDWPPEEQRVPGQPRDKRPKFMVVGGLVILELHEGTARGMSRSPGGVILRRYNERKSWDPPMERRRIVYVDRVFSDPTNKGIEDLKHAPILSVNGVPIRAIEDVAKALEAPPERGFHVFRLEGLESDYVIPAAKLDEIDERITKTYMITMLRHLPEKEEEE
jgi:hypothetical protein